MIVTNQMRRALARLKEGPALNFDIGVAVGAYERTPLRGGGVSFEDKDRREHTGRVGQRVALKLLAAELATVVHKRGLDVYVATRKGREAAP